MLGFPEVLVWVRRSGRRGLKCVRGKLYNLVYRPTYLLLVLGIRTRPRMGAGNCPDTEILKRSPWCEIISLRGRCLTSALGPALWL